VFCSKLKAFVLLCVRKKWFAVLMV
jgi:hypothetical protein